MALEAELCDQAFDPVQEGRRPGSLPTSRPAALHGHSDARRRGSCADCGRPPRPCSCVDNSQRVRPRGTRRRQTCGAAVVPTTHRGHVSLVREAQSIFGLVGKWERLDEPRRAFNPRRDAVRIPCWSIIVRTELEQRQVISPSFPRPLLHRRIRSDSNVWWTTG